MNIFADKRLVFISFNWERIQLNRSVISRVSVNWLFLLVCLNEALDIGVWRVWHTIWPMSTCHEDHPQFNNSSLMCSSNWDERSTLCHAAYPQLPAAIHWHLTDNNTSCKFVLQQVKVICLSSGVQTVGSGTYAVQAHLYMPP